MSGAGRGAVLHDLERLLREGVAPPGDGDLLERFRSTGDEAAFEALVTRHGPMVRGVCHRFLRGDHDVDDAFQATFLVLARKAAGLRDPDRLGPWLYGVASRVAAKARARNLRRGDRPLIDDIPARDDPRAEWSDVRPILDAELARLPSKQRDVLVLCLLGGASEDEASRRLACPVGTVKSRLSRAKEALRGRLVRRGVTPAAALAAASSAESFASPVSMTLLRATLATISAKAAIPPAVAALTQGVAPTMFSKPILSALALAGSLATFGLTAAAWYQPSPPPPQDVASDGPKVEKARTPSPRAATERNLRQILLAMHNFYSTNDAFPTAAIRGANGRPLLSWRVAILPYLGAESNGLYHEFRLDEPWDSPHNQTLIPRMPEFFQTPGVESPPGQTRIRGYAGPDAMFGPELGEETATGVRFEDVRDGAPNTAFLTVAAEPTIWTRPGELSLVPRESFGKPDASDPKGYVFAMADGSIRHFADTPGRDHFVLAALSRSGGEVIPWEVASPKRPPHAGEVESPFQVTEGATVGVPADPRLMQAAPADRGPTPAPDLESRFRRVEEKLDQILERLDEMTRRLDEGARP
ncbi:sigma-70 family RNA polymerase sigma factor [Planctomyces sp. SH-PL62]|uniref:sigma-70 family RNA polymerase sigma factor n=1 Tax=Planctomyces sp. SH-PL62 TaxID=1636152 RepID=UPI00078D0976|nr:sigma-70 family RNA polymerase sigma factor [Planctomyces sp. SH-PL62]AMV36247.1 ECF RNA polymerase sigma factor SigE [Planctomyces sp. SH-PL62]